MDRLFYRINQNFYLGRQSNILVLITSGSISYLCRSTVCTIIEKIWLGISVADPDTGSVAFFVPWIDFFRIPDIFLRA
jgi:hypothetical protein